MKIFFLVLLVFGSLEFVRAQDSDFSGLIVDARDENFMPCMSPKIFARDGSELWGTVTVSTQYANEVGIASFVRMLEDARK